MAKPVEFSIHLGCLGTGDFAVSLTYRLEDGETDVMALATEKASEAKAIRERAWSALGGNGAPAVPDNASAALAELAGDHPIPGDPLQLAAEPAIGVPTELTTGTFTGAEETETLDEAQAPATVAQLCLIESLWQGLEYGAESKRCQLLAASGHEVLDSLTAKQAARIIVNLSGASRARLEAERAAEAMAAPINDTRSRQEA